MYLEAFIWSWINLHPGFVLKKLAKLMALAALVLLPLLYINVDMARKGFAPAPPRMELQVAQPFPGEN
jgi:hypothetical protein